VVLNYGPNEPFFDQVMQTFLSHVAVTSLCSIHGLVNPFINIAEAFAIDETILEGKLVLLDGAGGLLDDAYNDPIFTCFF
jgi:hypothetical protein